MSTRDEAFAVLRKYNKDPFHIQHELTAICAAFAKSFTARILNTHMRII